MQVYLSVVYFVEDFVFLDLVLVYILFHHSTKHLEAALFSGSLSSFAAVQCRGELWFGCDAHHAWEGYTSSSSGLELFLCRSIR